MPLLDSTGKPALPPGTVAFRIARADAATLEHGKIVQYRVVGHNPAQPLFVMAASRNGVEMEGHMPCLPTQGMVMVLHLLRRIIRQHEALATKVGEPQVPLTEEELDAFDRADAEMAASGSRVVRFPGGNGLLPHAKGV